MPNRNLPVGLGTSSLAVQDANVTDEIAGTGLALGELVTNTGSSVAETQKRLNATSAETATALAQTLVDVIAVEEKVYRDDGTLDHVTSHTRQLPLINFIDPTFYQWTNVRIQGQFVAREFATAGGSTSTSSSSKSGSSQSGLLVILGGGQTKRSSVTTTTGTTNEATNDTSYGRIRMNSLLKPREDIGVPRPRQVIQGPRLSLIQGAIEDVMDEGGVLTARTMSVLIQYHKRDGTPIAGKSISVETDGVPWSVVGDATTSAEGQMEIQLRREFVDETVDTSPVDVIVTARIGIVSNNTVVTF